MGRVEKRERERIDLALPVEYFRIDSDARLIGGLHRGYTVNVSQNGFMVHSRDEIPTDSDVRIKLFFSFPDLRWVETLSQVIWIAKGEKGSDYLSGIGIVRIVQDLRTWEQFWDNLFR